jgi:uncharacterized protein (DUF1015 family)
VPLVRPFRALRYEADSVGDLALVTSPPYDTVGAEEYAALLARHPKNVIRLDLPADELGDEADDRYRRVARTFAAWRSDGTFHKDPRPSLYAYEQTYMVPGTDVERTQRGFFGRLRLEAFGSGAVLPHERTLALPREDRYKLLRATGANMSPIVGLFGDPGGRAAALLAGVAEGGAGPAVAEVTDPDGVRHRMWVLPTPAVATDGHVGDAANVQPVAAPATEPVAELAALASAGPITIADGHHRYETALRYRDERRMSRSCEEDPAFDYVLMLFLATDEGVTVLPTHRIARDVGDPAPGLIHAAGEMFDVHRTDRRADLEAAFGPAAGANDRGAGGRGRFGLWTRNGGAIITAQRGAFEPYLPAGGPALRRLDVTLLQAALAHLAGIDAAATAAGRIGYTKSVTEALDAVDARVEGADAAFLLEATPVGDIVAVAHDGDLMPQKSTYFYPKPLSGLVLNPLEW